MASLIKRGNRYYVRVYNRVRGVVDEYRTESNQRTNFEKALAEAEAARAASQARLAWLQQQQQQVQHAAVQDWDARLAALRYRKFTGGNENLDLVPPTGENELAGEIESLRIANVPTDYDD